MAVYEEDTDEEDGTPDESQDNYSGFNAERAKESTAA